MAAEQQHWVMGRIAAEMPTALNVRFQEQTNRQRTTGIGSQTITQPTDRLKRKLARIDA